MMDKHTSCKRVYFTNSGEAQIDLDKGIYTIRELTSIVEYAKSLLRKKEEEEKYQILKDIDPATLIDCDSCYKAIGYIKNEERHYFDWNCDCARYR